MDELIGSIDFNELLSYAQRVSKHTMSPINPNTWVIEPPIPQDSHMRMSLLFRQDQLLTEKTVQGMAKSVLLSIFRDEDLIASVFR